MSEVTPAALLAVLTRLAAEWSAAAARPSARTHLQDIAARAAATVAALKTCWLREQAEAAAAPVRARMADALELAADAYWEADPHLRLRHVAPLNPGAAGASLGPLYGAALPALLPHAAVLMEERFTGQAGELISASGRPLALVLSGRRLESGGWHGLARLREERPLAERPGYRLLAQLAAAHEQEMALRRETEILLDGLRLLTGGKPGAQVFAGLLALLRPALEYDAALILQREWDGTYSVLAASAPELSLMNWAAAAARAFAGEERAERFTADDPLTPGMRWRSALAVKIKEDAHPAILLCLHEAPAFFSTGHAGLGARLSLMAAQAFLNDAERRQVLDHAKLAAIGEMAAGIVHEINQPLTVLTLAIANFEDAVAAGQTEAGALAARLTRLREQTDRIAKIIASMKSLSRRAQGAVRPFPLARAVEDALTLIAHKLDQADIDIEICVPPGLEALGEPVECAQLIVNFLSNAHDAIEAVPRARAKRRLVTIRAQEGEPGWLDLWVRDTGCGFPPHHVEKAFEPFFTTKPQGTGTGLGLALSRRIVETMGGTIALSNWDEGAQIHVRLRSPDAATEHREIIPPGKLAER